MGRTPLSLFRLARHLRRAGHGPWVVGYVAAGSSWRQAPASGAGGEAGWPKFLEVRMRRPWFRPWGWIHRPASWPGVGIGVFPYFVPTMILLIWVASKSSAR